MFQNNNFARIFYVQKYVKNPISDGSEGSDGEKENSLYILFYILLLYSSVPTITKENRNRVEARQDMACRVVTDHMFGYGIRH